jgi:kynurenine formamidase
MAVYPGDPPIDIKPLRSMPEDKVNMLGLNMSTHHGTHIDAPYYQLTDGQCLDKFPPNVFIKRAMRIDICPQNEGPNIKQKDGVLYRRVITAEDLLPYAQRLTWVEAVVIYTGYGRVLLKNEVDQDFPYLDTSAAELLDRFKNLNIIGIDSLSVDAPGENKAHHILCGEKNRMLLETLICLDQLPLSFTLCCFPLLIKDSDGAPCRAIAFL